MDGARSSGILLVLVVMMGVMHACWAYDFYVGGRDGWVPNPSVSFSDWAQRNRFQINDRLVFRIKNESDSILVVSREDYDRCNTSTPIKKLQRGESASFQFDRSGPFFFISGVAERCKNGQKLIVVVMAPRNWHRIAPSSAPLASHAPSPSVVAAASPGSKSPSGEVELAPALSPDSEAEDQVRQVSAATSGVGVSVVVAALALFGGVFLA